MVVAMTQQMGKTMNEPMKAGPRAVVIAVEHGVDGTAPAWQVEVATRSQLASRESKARFSRHSSQCRRQLLPLMMRQTLSGGQ